MIPKYKDKKFGHNDESNPYWLSISDVMSGLLIIFILACVVLLYNLKTIEETKAAELEEQKRLNENLNQIINLEKRIKEDIKLNIKQIKDNLRKEGIFVEINENTILIPDEAINFEIGKDEIPEDKIYAVQKIGKEIFQFVNKNKDIDTVFIEGHTDMIPLHTKNGNWGLSASRAIFIWKTWTRFFCETGEYNCDQMLNQEGKPIFSVSGYADTRPVLGTEGKTDEKSLRKNRRIEIRIVPRTPSREELSEGVIYGG